MNSILKKILINLIIIIVILFLIDKWIANDSLKENDNGIIKETKVIFNDFSVHFLDGSHTSPENTEYENIDVLMYVNLSTVSNKEGEYL